MNLAYAAITPARDEVDNLPHLARSLAAQSLLPALWIVVDDGSTDGTRAVVEELAMVDSWIAVIDSPGTSGRVGPLEAGRRQGRDVLAFNAGIAALSFEPDVVLKLDADVTLDPDFFERMLREFEMDPELGIAGGVCLELEAGAWKEQFVTGDHVRGATRAYRWSCLLDVAPLVEQLGWDGIDEVKAALHGWRVRTIPGLPFYHHRSVGRRDGLRESWESQGATARFMGYRFSYLVLRSLFQSRRDPRALAMILGWLRATARRDPVYGEPEVVAHLRRQQSLRCLPARAREALGRR